MSTHNKVLVGLSGGVDSSVAAHRLLELGYRVEALFMKNWDEDDEAGYCPAEQDLADAQTVAEQLGITLHKISFSTEYWDRVFAYFLAEYRAGRTPNPDVMCNKEIKFKAFLDYAIGLGADFIATGHYARVDHNEQGSRLLKGRDHTKDQSYFLHLLNQSQLARTLFPLGDLKKNQVRELARRLGFVTHDKKDSTGICFIGERKFKDFLQRFLPAQPGDIITDRGDVIGRHDGLMYHTIGQRQGLHIGGIKEGSGEAWYVADKDLVNNRLIVVQGASHPHLFNSSVVLNQLNWIPPSSPTGALRCQAKIRYRQDDQSCILEPMNEHQWRARFDEPQRAVAPGQSIVFYAEEECLGGGTIEYGTDNE